MPFRLFGTGSTQVRPCPACERKIKADATFCPSCYMVFRPEGAAALREYLQGARIPADVYRLRKMQTEDPNAGPVTRAAPEPAAIDAPPTAPVAADASESVASTTPSACVEADVGDIPTGRGRNAKAEPPDGHEGRPQPKCRNGVEGFLAFAAPLPPPARSVEDVPALYAWMLEKDPVIPNNLARLEEIHVLVFGGQPAGRLGYEQHLLLQVAEDLRLYAAEDALGFHLAQLAAAYRRAADAYRKAEHEGSAMANHALWQMASLASRMRLEAWVYHARHGDSPQLPSTRQRELPLRFPGN